MNEINVYQDSTYLLTWFLLSLVATILVYSFIPLLFALIRKNPITKTSYGWCCFGLNAIIKIVFNAINSTGNTSYIAFILWTAVFSFFGAKILAKKGILVASIKKDSSAEESITPVMSTVEIQTDSPTTEHVPVDTTSVDPTNYTYIGPDIKPKQKRSVITWILLTICIALCILIVVQFIYNAQLKEQNTALEAKIESQKIQISELKRALLQKTNNDDFTRQFYEALEKQNSSNNR